MAGAPYYRSEAERCRKRAADDPASESAKRWLQLAAEYEQLADALEEKEEGAQPGVQWAPMQQQPMQQQQSKAEPTKRRVSADAEARCLPKPRQSLMSVAAAAIEVPGGVAQLVRAAKS